MAENKKSSTGKKKPTKKETETYRQEEIRFQLEQEQDIKREISFWLIIAASIILEMSNFGLCGAGGNLLSAFIKGISGWMAYLIPVLWILSSAVTFFRKGNSVNGQKFTGFFLMILFICMALSMFTYRSEIIDPASAYTNASQNISLGGGFIGGLLQFVFMHIFNQGAWIINIVMLIISAILISGKSAMHSIENQGKKAVTTARETNEKVIRNVTEHQDDLNFRKTRKHTGIGEDTKVGGSAKNPAGSDDMSEIIVDTYPPEEPSPSENPEGKSADVSKPDPFDLKKTSPSQSSAENLRQLTVPSMNRNGRVTKASDRKMSHDQTVPNYDLGVHSAAPDILSDEDEETFTLQSLDLINEPDSYDPANLNDPEAAAGAPDMGAGKSSRKTRISAAERENGIQAVAEAAALQENQTADTPYVFPTSDLLTQAAGRRGRSAETMANETQARLEKTLRDFGVDAQVTGHSCGPAVTRFEIQPAAGVKVSRIVGLTDDIKLNLAAADIRIEAPIPGKSAIGIEVPNAESSVVSFRELIESDAFSSSSSKITFAVGKDLAGCTKIADIAKMPHLLIAGATGSGKSVCINTIIMSILFKARPEEVKLIMIDPKVVELSVYNGIPHLMIPVVTDPKKAAGALNWAVQEMTNRYQDFAEMGVRDIKGYNAKVATMPLEPEQERPAQMPQIVIIVDELADLMMVASKDVEEAICRLAQLARAAGIHLVIATQRPSVNVITGLIKANMPSRIAFAVTSGVDSRTILDMNGAEKLLGKGDMLFDPQGSPKPQRIQGAFVSDEDVQKVVDFVKAKNGVSVVSNEILKKVESMQSSGNTTVSISSGEPQDNGQDPLFADAARIIVDKDKASIGSLQRYLKVGFNRAARIMDALEEAGVVGPEEGTKPRMILMDKEKLEEYLEQNG